MEQRDTPELEAESITKAKSGGGSLASPHADEPDGDVLEKATTQASRSSKAPVERIKTAQDWTGPGDPGNPLNWSTWKKVRHIFPVALLGFAVTLGSSAITSATGEIEEYFHVSSTAAILASLTVYVVGLGMGPVIGAPLSENYGRTVIYQVTPVFYMLFLLGAGFSKSYGSLLVCRLLAGIAGAPVIAVGTGTNSDVYSPQSRARAMSMFAVAPFLGPALGPVIGGFAAQYRGWRWTQWCTIFVGVAAWALCLTMEETYKKVILRRRAKKYNLPPPPSPQLSRLAYAKLLLTITIARPVTMIFTEPTVLLFGIYSSFTFSVLFAFFAAFPYTFTKVYQFNTWQNGLVFLGIGIGVLLAAVSAITFDKFIYQKRYRAAVARGETKVHPEERLYVGMFGAFWLPVGLFWFAWTARPGVHWISPILAGIPFAFGNLSIFIATVLYMTDVYGPLNGASAMAANGLMRYVSGGAFPLFTIQMYSTLGIGWATSLLGFVCVALLPIPFVFYRSGPAIRARSRMSM